MSRAKNAEFNAEKAGPHQQRQYSFHGSPADTADLTRLLGDDKLSIVIPARNESATIGAIASSIGSQLQGISHELIVVDDASVDETAQIAEESGARVLRNDINLGKGASLERGTATASGDYLVFLDADVTDFKSWWIPSLVLPIVTSSTISLVKADYSRKLNIGGIEHPGSGGRVTRLVARPALSLVAPELTFLSQPLSGETALRKSLLSMIQLGQGYTIELKLLLDTYQLLGAAAIAQVNLGERNHSHHSDEALTGMATEVLRTAFEYAARHDRNNAPWAPMSHPTQIRLSDM